MCIILGAKSYLFRLQGAILREVHTIHPYTKYIVRFSRTRSLWTTYCHICLYTQPRKYKQLRACKTIGSILYVLLLRGLEL